MLKRAYIFPMVLLLFAGGATPAEIPLEKPSTFGNASVQLPKGWVVISSSNAGLKAKAPQADRAEPAGTPAPTEPNEFSANVSIKVAAVAGEVDMAAQQKTLEDSLKLSNYRRVEESTPVTLGEAKGITFGGTFVTMGGKVPVRTRLYLVTHGGKLYVIAFSTLASRWSQYQPQIEASVKTFGVKG